VGPGEDPPGIAGGSQTCKLRKKNKKERGWLRWAKQMTAYNLKKKGFEATSESPYQPFPAALGGRKCNAKGSRMLQTAVWHAPHAPKKTGKKERTEKQDLQRLQKEKKRPPNQKKNRRRAIVRRRRHSPSSSQSIPNQWKERRRTQRLRRREEAIIQGSGNKRFRISDASTPAFQVEKGRRGHVGVGRHG